MCLVGTLPNPPPHHSSPTPHPLRPPPPPFPSPQLQPKRNKGLITPIMGGGARWTARHDDQWFTMVLVNHPVSVSSCSRITRGHFLNNLPAPLTIITTCCTTRYYTSSELLWSHLHSVQLKIASVSGNTSDEGKLSKVNISATENPKTH